MATEELPPAFVDAAAAMPAVLRALLVDGASTASVHAGEVLQAALPTLPSLLPVGSASDVLQRPALLSPASCEALRTAVESGAGLERDTVDGAEDQQLNLSTEELIDLIGCEAVDAILGAGRELDLKRGGSGRRPLPLVEAFVRRYTPQARPWHPFHTDRAAVTVNVAISDDICHRGGRLIGLFDDGASVFERAEGTATVHLSRVVHGVTRMLSGTRYSLICFLGDEPAVRRELVDDEWTRTIVEP